jgi:uncharacterized protein YciI
VQADLLVPPTGWPAIAGDPFVQHGLVAGWTVRPWNEVLAP